MPCGTQSDTLEVKRIGPSKELLMRNIPDYFDPVGIARQEGYNQGELLGLQRGRQAGYMEGHADGHAEGFAGGHEAGYQQGWNEAIARGNEEMLKQLASTRQHVADKATMAEQLGEQHELIKQMAARLDQIEREHANLLKSNQGLRDMVTALSAANEDLKSEVGRLDGGYKARTEEYCEQVRQYNRGMVFMNAARATLEELIVGKGAQATEIRGMFAKQYQSSVSGAVEKGAIKVAPDQDESFALALPKTHGFILDMLGKVA